MAFSTLAVDFTARLAGFEEGINKASRDVDKLGSRVGAVASGIKSTFASLGVGLGVGGLAAIAKSGIDAADSLNDMSQRLGVSVKDLASFKLAADQSGTSLDSVGAGIARLSRSIGEAEGGNKQLAGALQSLGITARDPKEAFFQLADAVQKMDDPNKRAALLSQVLGKSYGELVPLLNQGSDALRESAKQSETFADAMSRLAPDADKFNDQLEQLRTNSAGFAASILADVVPALNTVFDRFDRLAKLRAGGASIGELLTGTFSADTAASIKKVNDEIRVTEKELSLMPAGGFDPLGDRNALEEKLARLKSVKATLRDISLSGAMELADQQYKKTPKTSGATDFSKALSSGAKSDPLSGILKQTDTARAREYEKLLGLLDARFQSGRRNAQQYQEAIAVLNKQFGREAIDPLGSGSFSTTSKDVAEFIREQQDAINGLNGEMAQDGVRAAQEYQSALDALLSDTTLAKTDKLQANIDLLDQAFFDGAIGAGQYDEAIAKLTSGASSKLKETKSIAEELGLTFTSAFEDAVVGGEKFSDVLKGLERDIARIITRKTVTEPFGNAVSSMFSSGFSNGFGNGQNLFGDIASLFGFATGGSFTVGGSGGTDSQLVAFRATPGEMVDVRTPGQAAGGGGVSIVQHINIDSRSDQASILAAMAQARDAAVAAVQSSLRRGGSMAQLTAT